MGLASVSAECLTEKESTSLVLLLEKPLRFSVDIDITVSPELQRASMEEYLSKITGFSEFIRMKLDESPGSKFNDCRSKQEKIYKDLQQTSLSTAKKYRRQA